MSSEPIIIAYNGGPACAAQKRQGGGPCMKPAGWGTNHLGYGRCRVHGGNTKNHRKSHAMQEAQVEYAKKARVMGIPMDVDPMDALLWCVRITAGEVAYASYKVEELDEDEAVLLPVEEIERQGGGENVAGYEKKSSNEAMLHIWIRTRQLALERLAKFSKMAIDAGVAQRQVELAEGSGESIALAVREILDGLNLTAEQEDKVPSLVRTAFRRLEAPPAGGQEVLDAA